LNTQNVSPWRLLGQELFHLDEYPIYLHVQGII
jgi:hypothetical protein